MTKKALIIIGSSVGVLVFAGIFWYLSMSNNKELIKRIPKNSMAIGKVDLKALASKAKFDQWKTLDMFKDMKEELEGAAGQTFEKMLEKPKDSGFNFFTNAYGFAATKVGQGGDKEMFGGVVFGVLDGAEVKATLASISNGEVSTTESNGIFTAELDGSVVLVWNNEVGMLYFGESESITLDALAQFNQEKESSALTSDAFMEQESLDADLSLFVNYSSISDLTAAMGGQFGEQVENAQDSYKNYEAAGTTVLFDDEQVIMESQIYLKEGVDEESIQMTAEDGVAENDLNLFAPENPKGFVLVNLALKNLVPMWEPYLKDMDLTQQDFLDAFTGQIGLSFMGVKEEQVISIKEEYLFEEWDLLSEEEPPVILVQDTSYELLPIFKLRMAVKNKNALVKLLESAMGEPMDSLRNENGYYALNESEFPMFMKVGDDSFEMVSNKDFFGKSNTNWDSELAGFASSQPGTFYLNLNYQMYPDLTKEMGRDFDQMRPFLDMLKDVRGTMSGMNSHFEINFTESKDPILYRFMLAVNDAYVRNRPMKEVSEN